MSTIVIHISAAGATDATRRRLQHNVPSIADTIAYVAGEDPLRVLRMRMIRPVHRLEDPVGARADGVGMSARDAR